MSKGTEVINKLKTLTKDWTMSARLTAINEELHNEIDYEAKVEILMFKSEVLEAIALRGTSCVHCSHDDYFN